jgi:hypothetical protein
VKLLKPKDTLLLGQVYRLITSQGTRPLCSCRFDPSRMSRGWRLINLAVGACRGDKGSAGAEAGEDAYLRRGNRAAAAAAAPEAAAAEAEGRGRRRSQRRTETAHRSPGNYHTHDSFTSLSYVHLDRNRSSVCSFLVQERKRLEKDRHRSVTGGGGRGRHWRPSLQSITELSS